MSQREIGLLDFLSFVAGLKQNYATYKTKKEVTSYVYTHSTKSCRQKQPVNYGSFNLAEHRNLISQKSSMQ